MKKIFSVLLAVAFVVSLAVAMLPSANAQQATYSYSYNPRHVITVTGNYTALITDDWIRAANSAADATVTLPAISSSSFGGTKTYKISKEDAGRYAVTIAAAAGNTVGGVSTKTLAFNGDYIIIQAQNSGTNWAIATQYSAVSNLMSVMASASTFTGTVDTYMIAPKNGTLYNAELSAVDALGSSASNYLTFTATNLGLTGAGSTAMLATGQTTSATAIAANTLYTLSLVSNATGSLNVHMGDRILLRAATTGTLANTVTYPVWTLRFTDRQ